MENKRLIFTETKGSSDDRAGAAIPPAARWIGEPGAMRDRHFKRSRGAQDDAGKPNIVGQVLLSSSSSLSRRTVSPRRLISHEQDIPVLRCVESKAAGP
jgi:hypothetical protein